MNFFEKITTKKALKVILIALLLIVCIVSVGYAYSTYQNNKKAITLQLEYLAQQAALPYHLAKLSTREPVEELPVPVFGAELAGITDTWNASRANGRSHEGTDIFAERGTPVFSATEGYVIRKNIGTLGGTNVMVAGPGGVGYYYAHLSRIAEGIDRGERVTPETVLGFVGNSGNAEGTPPHLHLGVYPSRGSWQARNPYPLLVDRWE